MQIRIPGLPHPVYVTKANRAQEPNQFEPLFRYGSHYALFDRAAGFETPNTPLGTPIYYYGYVVEGTASVGESPPHVTWCLAKDYLAKHNIPIAQDCSAEFTVLQKLMHESASVRAVPVFVIMSNSQWLQL